MLGLLWGCLPLNFSLQPLSAQSPAEPRIEDVEMTARVDGTSQRYLLVYPPDFREDCQTDLLFVLHGHGSDRWQAVRNAPAEFKAASDIAAARGMLLVSPDYRARTSWMGPAAEADMLQILGELKARFAVRKVFLLGASMGGASVLTFAALHPDQVDGVVSENGTANHLEYEQFQDAIRESFGGSKSEIPEEYRKRSAEFWPAKLTMPVGITAGGQDALVPPQSVLRLARILAEQNPATKLIYHEDGGHNTTYEESRAVLEFVIEQATRPQWARPVELRTKKLIDAAIYTLDSSPIPVDSRALAANPQFTSTHPFDGIALRSLLDPAWCDRLKQQLQVKDPNADVDQHLDSWLWSNVKVPEEAVRDAISDLQRVRWGSLTDNFLWSNFRGGERVAQIDIANDADWEAVEHNARITGKLCREARLKGLLFDTEQYTHYAGSGDPYPLGRGSAELRRERGRRWIQALQSECPDIRIIIFFAWSPDLDSAGFLKGVRDFLDGMLEGIEEPARLIHGYENTFYYGQRAGSRFTPDGFPGHRTRYESTHDLLRSWRNLSRQPEKYDRFVDVGMAAWLESDPWNLWSGWPSGTKDTIWSNVPLALATTDEYVWCWSEHCNFLHQRAGESAVERSEQWLNPCLASLANQTFNLGTEPATAIVEDFTEDPLLHGWYFDFDMLSIGRKPTPGMASPIFTREAMPFQWDRADRSLQVLGTWMTGDAGNIVARLGKQRRRYVHPLAPVTPETPFKAKVDFEIDAFGEDPLSPMVIGLFQANSPVDGNSLALRVSSNRVPTICLAGDSGHWNSSTGTPLEAGRTYRLALDYQPAARRLAIQLIDHQHSSIHCELNGSVPRRVGGFLFDEVGVAQFDGTETTTALAHSHRYRVRRVEIETKPKGGPSAGRQRRTQATPGGNGVDAGDGQAPLTVERTDDRLVITRSGKAVAQFVFRDPKILRPYFSNVHAPGGVQVTRTHPPVEGRDATDHDTMHPGIWLGLGDVSGADFWRNKARMEHVRFVDDPQDQKGRLTFSTETRLVDPQGNSVCDLTNRYTIAARPAGLMLIWNATFTARDREFIFGDQEEMGFGARVATELTEKSGGRLTNSRAETTAAGTWGRPAAWCDYSGMKDDHRAGITLMASPGNFRESWWHNRDYGVFVANPFGRAAMRQGAASRIVVPRGESFQVTFAAVAHDSEDYDPAKAYADFLELIPDR